MCSYIIYLQLFNDTYAYNRWLNMNEWHTQKNSLYHDFFKEKLQCDFRSNYRDRQ